MSRERDTRTAPLISKRHAAYLVLIALALIAIDHGLSDNRSRGRRRRAIARTIESLDRATDARVLMVGMSTTQFWLGNGYLERALGLERGAVAEGGSPACHQACVWALARRLLEQGRHYDSVFYGINQFQMCERPHSVRAIQHRTLVSASDLPTLFRLYAFTRDPLMYYGRYLGATVSGTYEYAAAVRTWLGRPLKMRREGRTLWYTSESEPRFMLLACSYDDDETAFQRAATETLVTATAELASRTALLLLPDRSLHHPEYAEAWRRHRAFFRGVADRHAQVTLIDLSRGGAAEPTDFGDALHINAAGRKKQRALFERGLRRTGFR